ncbi:MAG: hypothetical protein AcusKO_15300 [Acuticoccus sp.]
MARICLLLLFAMFAAVSGEHSAAAQTRIVAVVNGQAITSYDVAQRQKLLQLTGARSNLRKSAIDELIDEAIQDQAVKRANIIINESEVDAAIGDIAARAKISPAQLAGAFRQAGVSVDTLRSRIRSQMGFARLVQATFRSTVQVTEQELVAALKRDEERDMVIDAPLYELQQVTIALPQNPSAQRRAQAEKRARDLRSRFNSCSQGLAIARKTRNVVVRDGGRRMGIDFAPPIRKILDETPVGKLSEPVPQARGLVMFAVCDKKIVRSANAAMKEIEPELTNTKGVAFSKQYLRQLKRDAVIERRS